MYHIISKTKKDSIYVQRMKGHLSIGGITEVSMEEVALVRNFIWYDLYNQTRKKKIPSKGNNMDNPIKKEGINYNWKRAICLGVIGDYY